MYTLAFDGRMGASGDMLLGALLAAGADRDALRPVEDALGVTYDVSRTDRNGIEATRVVVRFDGDHPGTDGDRDRDHEGGHGHDHPDHHDYSGHHDDRDRDHSHDHGGASGSGAEGHGPHRTFAEVRSVVEGMALPAGVIEDATATFRRLGEAEAAVHGTDVGSTAFHEVGADDAIADVVGAALLLDDLDPDRIVTTPLATGGGEVSMSHGTYPVPPPAVVNVADGADWELRGGPVDAELLTPTGAALLAEVAEGVETLPTLRVERSGYGAGCRSFSDRPNVLRALVGTARGGLVREGVRLLETNVDDVSPEALGGLQERLADAGARDVSVVPLTMKKSRPGHLVRVVVAPEDAGRVARRLAAETGTLGVRETGTRHRFVARRRVHSVEVSVAGVTRTVGVKVATDDAGDPFDVSAEYDDAAALAAETDRPAREVMRLAEAAWRERTDADVGTGTGTGAGDGDDGDRPGPGPPTDG